MSDDPSFILKHADARDLVGYARALQKIVETRSVAAQQPTTVAESDFLDDDDDANPPPGQRAGEGSASILPYLKQSLASRPRDGR